MDTCNKCGGSGGGADPINSCSECRGSGLTVQAELISALETLTCMCEDYATGQPTPLSRAIVAGINAVARAKGEQPREPMFGRAWAVEDARRNAPRFISRAMEKAFREASDMIGEKSIFVDIEKGG